MSSSEAGRAGSRAKTVRTPDDIARDVRGLKLRHRVSLPLDGGILREDLEEMILERAHLSADQVNLRTYQDLVLFAGDGVKPVSDIRGADTLNYSKADRLTRCKLAAVYRLVHLLKWGEGIFDHIMCTVQGSDDDPSFLVGPHGLLFSEITASTLVKVNSEGEVIDSGSTNLGVYRPVLALHLAIHSARQDGKCLMFLNTETVKAVAATKAGLLPISHDAVTIGEVSYHIFPGFVLTEDVKESLSNKLGASNKVMILHNFGAICIGESVEETFQTALFFVKACENQVNAMRIGMRNLLTVEIQTQGQVLHAFGNDEDENIIKQKQAKAHFEAWMHWLDSKGYKTDYDYSNPELYRQNRPGSSMNDQQRKSTDPPRRSKSGRANEYGSRRGKLQSSPVKATRYRQEIIEPEMMEMDFNKNWGPEDEKMDKHDSNDEAGTPNGLGQETLLQPDTVGEQLAAPDFEVDSTNREDPGPDHVGDEVTVTPEKVPDAGPGSPGQPSDGSVEPEGEMVRRRSGKKVKKRRSFREKLLHRISTG